MPNSISIGFIACTNFEEAKKIADALLEKRLVACANIVKEIYSSFFWKGKRENATEALLIVKTQKKFSKKIIEEIRRIHSYELPAIEFFEAETSKEAAEWIQKETKQK